MHQNGAKHLVLLSRSGPKLEVAKQLVAKLEKEGVEVYSPQCDITDREALKAVVQHVQQYMPPSKGAFNHPWL